MLRLGIEQEFVFADGTGQYLDADNSDYTLFSSIIEDFPVVDGDDVYFDCKSLETRPKRCYVEGFELHDAAGEAIETIPKALEIRTLPHASVGALVHEFRNSYSRIMGLARRFGLSPVLTSRHPFKTRIVLDGLIGQEEKAVRSPAALALAKRAMLTHGLHVNVSICGASAEKLADLVEKTNFYTPALIPWSFSSPFYDGRIFEGLCARNYFRADTRNMTDVRERKDSRLVEFRGFDACGDTRLLESLLRLFRGFLLDETLAGRSARQDPERLKLASIKGFEDPSLRDEGLQILQAAAAASDDESDGFQFLEGLLNENDSYAARMKRMYAETSSIMDCISGRYDF